MARNDILNFQEEKYVPNILEVHEIVKQQDDITTVKGITLDIKEGGNLQIARAQRCRQNHNHLDAFNVIFSYSRRCFHRRTFCLKRTDGGQTSIAVVPQELALYEGLTARENLLFWGQMYGLSGTALNSRVDGVLEQIGLADKAENRVKTDSGGMKHRVYIGVSLFTSRICSSWMSPPSALIHSRAAPSSIRSKTSTSRA